jgi:hypothetical protein
MTTRSEVTNLRHCSLRFTCLRAATATLCNVPQSLDAGSVAALPEGLRVDLEGIEDAGGVRFLQEMAAQIRVRCGVWCTV